MRKTPQWHNSKHLIQTILFKDGSIRKILKNLFKNTNTKQHICVHTPKPKLDIVLNVEKLKYMDKELIGLKIRAQNIQTLIYK